jgi:DNA-binding beta-propeller fold protein YncE
MSCHRRILPRLLLLCVLAAAPVLRAQTVAYVVSRADQNVTAIDLSTNTVVASIPTGPSITGAGGGISISPDGTHVYATTRQTIPGGSKEFVNVIDTATNSVSASVEVPGALRPFVSPDSARVYVATFDSVVVMDAATNSVVGSLAIPGVVHPYWIVPTATQIYVDDVINGDVYVVDAATNTLVTTIPEVPPSTPYFNAGALAMALSPDGSRLFVSHGGIRGFFSTIDTATNTRLTTVADVGEMPYWSIGLDGSTIYAIGIPDDGPYYTIDTATGERTTVGDFSQAWFGVAVAPDSGIVYLSNFDHNEIDAFDPVTNLQVGSIPLPSRTAPNAIVIGRVPPSVPMAGFRVDKLQINSQGFSANGSFAIGAAAFDPAAQRVVLSAGSFALTIPPGSFRKDGANLHWKFEGTVAGAKVNGDIKQQNKSTTHFDYSFNVNGPDLTPQPRPIRVGLRIGLHAGSALVP